MSAANPSMFGFDAATALAFPGIKSGVTTRRRTTVLHRGNLAARALADEFHIARDTTQARSAA